MLTGAEEERQLKAEYRRLLNHEMCGLNIALLRGEAEAAELKMQAVKNYMKRMTVMDWLVRVEA